jgi:tetratricopeptide (TPR) repeat protein
MSLLMGLFNLFALFYVFRSAQLAIHIGRNWTELRQPPLTVHKKRLVEQAAFFIAVPPAVLVHELLHAVATWAFCGAVREFGYRVFWGYVVSAGSFTPGEQWVIALAGTIGSLLCGLLLWLATRQQHSPALRFFGLRALRFQIYFSLIYYPVFTLFLPVGDWRTIYDFRATPLLSGLAAALHAAALLGFWLLDRRGRFEAPAAGSLEEAQQLAALQEEAARQPGDLDLQLRAIDRLRQSGATQQALDRLQQLLREHPHLATAHLLLAVTQSDGRELRPAAVKEAQRALQLGLGDAQQIALAHQLIGRFHLDRGDGKAAAEHFTQALAHTGNQQATGNMHVAQLHQLRSLALRRLREHESAYQDIQQAITLARSAGNVAAEARYLDDLEVLEKHAGRRLSSPA